MATEMNTRSVIYLTYKFHRDGPTAAFNIQLENLLWSQPQFCCAPHDGESPHVNHILTHQEIELLRLNYFP